MHRTAVAVFVRRGKICLEKRSPREDNYAGFWAFPGGHKRPVEKIERTLLREMLEELNTKVTKYSFIGKFHDIDPTSGEAFEHNAFLCTAWKGAIRKTTEEERIKWLGVKEALKKRIRAVDRAIIATLKAEKKI